MSTPLKLLVVCTASCLIPGVTRSSFAGPPPEGAAVTEKPQTQNRGLRYPTLDLRGYLAELDRWSAEAQRLESHPELAGILRKQLPEAWPVRIGQQEFSVPTTWLRDTLRSLEANHHLAADYSAEIISRLAEMREEARDFEEDHPSVNPGTAAAALHRVLQRREFRNVESDTWLDRLREALIEWWVNLLRRLFGTLSVHTKWSTYFVSALVVGSVALLMAWLVRIALGRAPANRLGLEAPALVEKRWQDWARAALAAANLGDYREAIRLAYWAAVYRLAESGAWQVDASRTHREYLRLLTRDDARRPSLAAVTTRFERTWYGRDPAQAGDFRDMVAQLESIGCSIRLTPQTASS